MLTAPAMVFSEMASPSPVSDPAVMMTAPPTRFEEVMAKFVAETEAPLVSKPCRGPDVPIARRSLAVISTSVKLTGCPASPIPTLIAVLPDTRTVAFAREDYYFQGILESHVHEVWAIRKSPRMGAGNTPTYAHRECFETFPLPWPPGKEPVHDPLYKAIAEPARELNELRERALNPGPPPEPDGLKKLTLTNLYNRMKAGELTWLANAHEKLDRAVFAAYGWSYPLDDQEILSWLLAENLRRAGT